MALPCRLFRDLPSLETIRKSWREVRREGFRCENFEGGAWNAFQNGNQVIFIPWRSQRLNLV